VSGFCFLWDKAQQWDPASLQRLGEQALDSLSHRFAGNRIRQSGEGWWLGVCRGHGEPQVSLATDGQQQLVVLLAGWLENYSDLLAEFNTDPNGHSRPDDVDLLLALYQREGPVILERVSGPLAILIWEPQRPRLIAVRDHLGESVVCFVDRWELLALASEEVALFTHPAVSKSPDFGWLGLFAARLPLPPGRTAFRDISELAPGEQGEWERISFRRRWIPPGLPTRLHWESDHRAYVAGWRDALRAGIPAATRRGRQFGLMLSGGMDSTTAAAFAVPHIQASGRQVAAYCWRFAQIPEADESAAIQAVADHLDVRVNWFQGDHLYPVLDPDEWPVCPNVPQLNPFLKLNLNAYEAARAAGCDVLLNGHLGDYLYPHHFHGLADSLRLRHWRQAKQELMRLLRRYGVSCCWQSPDLRWAIKLLIKVPPRQVIPSFLAGSARNQFERVEFWPPEMVHAPHPPQWSSLFGTISAMELKYELYFSARAGVERRHPLRHKCILESVLALPSYLFFGRLDKQLTRDAMVGGLPDQVVAGERGGDLNPLFLQGLWRTGKPTFKALLTDKQALWPEVICREYVLDALASAEHPDHQQQRVVNAVAGMELWWRAIKSV
jgi:hypothetical protein